jgi:Flp pilus assembly protein TadG
MITTHLARFARHLARLFGAHPSATAGVASIELAVIAPFLTLAIIGTADLGFGIYRNMQVQAAAQAGAEYAVVKGFTASGVSSAVTSATPFAGVQASPAPQQFCGCPTASGISPLACNASCPDASKPGGYVTVSARASYAPILPYPLLPASFELTAAATARLQ